MRIRVADRRLGECIINSTKDLGKGEEYAIKSLCMLQLMCMNSNSTDDNFKEFLKILREATKKLEKLYGNAAEDTDPFAAFNESNV